MSEDRRLERLYDYTKFHIGIYLGFSAALAGLISKAQDISFLKTLVAWPLPLVFSFVFMVSAGIAGAVVATSAIESETYTDFLTQDQGAYGIKPFAGKTWVTLEHFFFWLSLLALAVAILSRNEIWQWVCSA